ncbi:MAG: creatininase family protein [Sulfolobales archaeon]
MVIEIVFRSSSYKLGELTWEEAREMLREADFVVLPTGSFEQHGLHLPLLTDSIRAEYLSEELAKRAWEKGIKVLLLPVLYYGVSEHHMRFPGTITLRPEVYVEVIIDIGRSLARHGVKRFVILNFHGGNRAPLEVAVSRLRVEVGINAYLIHWTSMARDAIQELLQPVEPWGHACEYETSMIMLFRPELVKIDKMRKPSINPITRAMREAGGFIYFDEYSDTGGLGDPTRADPEKAREIIRRATDKIIELFKRL